MTWTVTIIISSILLTFPAWLRSWKLHLLALLFWSPIPRIALQRLPHLDRMNFGVLLICIVNYICWKISFLGRYVMNCLLCLLCYYSYTQTKANICLWIDTFFFRASAILSPDKCMLLNMEHVVPSSTIDVSSLSTLSGFVDYTAIIASQDYACKFWLISTPKLIVSSSYLSVISGSSCPQIVYAIWLLWSLSFLMLIAQTTFFRQYVSCMHVESFFSK